MRQPPHLGAATFLVVRPCMYHIAVRHKRYPAVRKHTGRKDAKGRGKRERAGNLVGVKLLGHE